MLPLMRDKQKERSKNRTPILYQPIPKQNQPSNSWKPTKTITLFETELSHVQAHQNPDRAFPLTEWTQKKKRAAAEYLI